MRDSTAQHTRHALWFWTKTTEIEKGWRKGEDQRRFDHISLERQTWSLRANMDPPPVEGNFCDESNSPMKPNLVEWYNWHMGYVDKSDHMANSYSMNRHTFKWTTKLFFHLLDLTLLKSWILLSSCEAKYTPWDIRLLVRNLIEEAEKTMITPPPDWLEDQVRQQQMLCDSGTAITNTGQRNHLPNSAAILCSSNGQRKGTVYKCNRCEVCMCVEPCFVEYHTRVNL